MCNQQPLTREELRDELQRFAGDTLGKSVPGFAAQVREELQQQLRQMLLECPPLQASCCPGSPAGAGACGPAPPTCLEQEEPLPRPTGARSGWASLGGVGDVEAEPRPGPCMRPEALQQAPCKQVSDASFIPHGDGEERNHKSRRMKRSSTRSIATDWFKRHYQAFHPRARRHEVKQVREGKLNSIPSVTRKRISNSAPCIEVAEDPGCLEQLVTSPAFDYTTGLFIVLNAASIGAQTDYMARNVTEAIPTAFRVIEIVFCVVFTLELLMRLAVYKTRFFSMQDWKWNMFDMLVVILQLMEELMVFLISMTGTAGSVQTDFSVVRIIKVLRLIRIIRLVRIMRLIGELRSIVVSIMGSLRSLFWTMLLLFLIIYLVAVHVTQIISDHRTMLKEADPQQDTSLDGVEDLCGTLGMTMVTLYQAITGGLSWQVITEPITNHIGVWASGVICSYIGFALFALMNIITGVFVESALATAKSDKDLFLLHFVKKLFQRVDKDQSGSVTWKEFEGCLDNHEMKMYFEALDLDVGEAKNLFSLLDISGTGSLQFDDFVNGCFRLRGSAKALDLATFMDAFNRWNTKWEPLAKRLDSRLAHLTGTYQRGTSRQQSSADSTNKETDDPWYTGPHSDDCVQVDNCAVFLGEPERGNI